MFQRFIKKANNIVKRFNKKSPVPLQYPMRMSDAEKKLFDKNIKMSQTYLEFGSGGSTFRTLLKTRVDVMSVESSREWLAFMRTYYFIRRMERKNRLLLFHADIGETSARGKPINDNKKHRFPSYSTDIFKNNGDHKIAEIDTVLVDGRFRVACVLNTILQCYSNKRLTILVHDFHREKFHIILKYLDVLENADTLYSFKIKDNIKLEQVGEDYDKYKFLPSH